MDDTTNPTDPQHTDHSLLDGTGAHITGDFSVNPAHHLTDHAGADPANVGDDVHGFPDLLDSIAPLLDDGGRSWRELMEMPALDSGHFLTDTHSHSPNAGEAAPDAQHPAPHLPGALSAASGIGGIAHVTQVNQAAQTARSTIPAPFNPLDMDTPDADEEEEGVKEDGDDSRPLFALNEEVFRTGGTRLREGLWTLLISDAAWNDLSAAGRKVADALGSEAANQFLTHLELVIGALGKTPEGLGTPRPSSDFGSDAMLTRMYVYYLSGGPYPCDIFYRCTPDPDGPGGPGLARVEILRILHGSTEQPWLFPDGDTVTRDGS